jgi:DNA-directed RNA polymerase subunit K/omega
MKYSKYHTASSFYTKYKNTVSNFINMSITKKHLSNYEKANIIHMRATLLNLGKVEPMIVFNETMSSIQIAKKEFEQGKLNYIIRREFSKTHIEDIPI